MLYIIHTKDDITRSSFLTNLKKLVESSAIRTWVYISPTNRFVFRAVSWRDYGSISVEYYQNDSNKLKIVFFPNKSGRFTDEDLEYARAVYFSDFTQMLLVYFSEQIHRLSIYP